MSELRRLANDVQAAQDACIDALRNNAPLSEQIEKQQVLVTAACKLGARQQDILIAIDERDALRFRSEQEEKNRAVYAELLSASKALFAQISRYSHPGHEGSELLEVMVDMRHAIEGAERVMPISDRRSTTTSTPTGECSGPLPGGRYITVVQTGEKTRFIKADDAFTSGETQKTGERQ